MTATTIRPFDEALRRRVHDRAYRQGLDPALAELHRAAGPGRLVCGPRGHALGPSELVHASPRPWPVSSGAVPPTTLSVMALAGYDTVAVSGWVTWDAERNEDYRAFGTALAWLRFGLSRRLLDSAVGYLQRRRVGAAPLLNQQLVRGALADAMIEHLEIHAVLEDAGPVGPDDPVLHDLNGQLTSTDRALLRLLGASGFVLGGPGQSAHASELLADVYLATAADRGGTP